MATPIQLHPRTEPGAFKAPQGSFASTATTFDEWLGDLHDYLVRRKQARGLIPPSAGVTKPLPPREQFTSVDDVFSAVDAWEGEAQARRGGAYRDPTDEPYDTYGRRRADYIRQFAGESAVAAERGERKTIGLAYNLHAPDAAPAMQSILALSPEKTARIMSGQEAVDPDQARLLLDATIAPVERAITEAATGQSLRLPETSRVALATLGYTDPPALDTVLGALKAGGEDARTNAARAILYRGDEPDAPEVSRRMRLAHKFLGVDALDYPDIPKVPSDYERYRVITKEPRGIRNNNPGNIEFNESVNWRGQTGTDGRFAKFESPVLGIRALARILKNYKRIHGINTVADVISRWAPSVENDTAAYVRSVAKATGFGAADEIDLEDPEVLSKIIPAIIKHENGKQPYEDETIREGISLA